MDAKTSRRLKKIFIHMKDRCYNPSDKRYKDWGGRGITICQQWLDDVNSFVEWAVKSGYKHGLSIDRIDNDKGYYPENCRWVTLAENNQNRRDTRHYTIHGETKNMTQWCKIYSIPWSTVDRRLKLGWDVEDAFTAPIQSRDKTSLLSHRFGRLTVVRFAGISKGNKTLYECVCDCGNTTIVTADKLKNGHTSSCGCVQCEMRHNFGESESARRKSKINT